MYTTTITVSDGDKVVGGYAVGPYAVPTPESRFEVMGPDTL
ncbi:MULTISPECIES: hypothetical protein [unclassified Microbacterium]